MSIFYLVHKINKRNQKGEGNFKLIYICDCQMMRQSSGNTNCKRNEYLALISCWQATYNYGLIF